MKNLKLAERSDDLKYDVRNIIDDLLAEITRLECRVDDLEKEVDNLENQIEEMGELD